MAGYSVNPAMAKAHPDDGAAALTRAQYQWFLDKGAPQEDSALRYIRDPQQPLLAANRAERMVNGSFTSMHGSENRTLQSFGVKPAADVTRVLNRREGLDKALAVTGARNKAFYTTQDTQLALSGDALNLGRNLVGQASQGLGSAARNTELVNQANKQASSSKMASTLSTAATLGAAGYALAGAQAGGMTGPVGAVVGAGIGLILGYLGT